VSEKRNRIWPWDRRKRKRLNDSQQKGGDRPVYGFMARALHLNQSNLTAWQQMTVLNAIFGALALGIAER